ncbi:MAG: AAA domain-containing protein [Planctomycetales bacterium]|nr:AAA domain-containing protein [Planctomycetales bacterium]
MSTADPYRLCPKCKSHRGVGEFFCANESSGVLCHWDMTNEEIHDGQSNPQPEAAQRSMGTGDAQVLHCPNGHCVSEGDLICPECNAELQSLTQTHEIAGWVVLSQLPTEGSVRSRYRVRRPSDGREAVITLYSPGAELDTTVYDALKERVPRDHIAEILEFGRWDERAYEVAEEILLGSLVSLAIEPSDTATIRRVVEEIGTALASFMDVGLRHRSLSPDKILVRSRDPLDVVISGFESGRLSDLDLDIESPLELTRYTAPEAIMGGVASASDWWGLGMILLGILTREDCFAGINERIFLIHVFANGAPIPTGLEPRLEMLLRGLLSVDRSRRWQWKEVRAWLDGESPPIEEGIRGKAVPETGPTITLGRKDYRDGRLFAIDASRAVNWNEACDLLAHGQIAQWAEALKLDGKAVSALRGLGQRIEPAVGFRLSVALQILNPQLPLIFEEAIVSPAWLLNNPAAGYELISGPLPDLINQYGLQSDNWLQRLAKRASAIRTRADALEITLDEDAFQVLALSTSRARLTAAWESRRRDFPDAAHPSLSSILERKTYSDEDLIILLAATIDQFRSCEEIIHEVDELASRYGQPTPAPEAIRENLTRTRRELHVLLDERIAGFARCGHERCDAWADQFRLERRLPIASVLLLLTRGPSDWAKPPHQEYVSSVLDFFEKKVSGAILRGQLVRMTIAKTTPRIDAVELAPDLESAAALLENLLQRTDRTFQLDSEIFESADSPEKRMRTLLARTLQYQRDTGINGSYIGFPFLLKRDRTEKSAARLAPILLWPVKLVGQAGSRGDFSLAFDSEGREVLLNPAFTGMFGLEGAKSWQELADDVLMRSVAKLGDIVDAFGVKAEPTGRTLKPLPRDLSGVAPGEERCVCSAVLFHMEFMGQSLVEDLRQLKQRPPENSALEPMLRVGESAPHSGESSGESATRITTSDRFLITDSDPSQEEAIARARSSPGLLIQGPPGTGKSQTIVNLVADCIGHRKSVLIVCQKLPALEVVKKRLVAAGLENRLAMVTNVVKDRQPLLRAIRDQLDTLTEADASQAKHNEREASVLATQIEKLESQIDDQYHAAVRVDNISGLSYRQILAELIALEERASRKPLDAAGLRRLFAEQADVAIADLDESCGAVAAQWLVAEYENNPLSATRQFPHDDASIAEFQSALEEFNGAEVARVSLPAKRNPSLPNTPPEGLDEWVRKYQGFLEVLTDSQFAETVPLLPVFRNGDVGGQYSTLLEALLSLQRGHLRQPSSAEGLQDVLASLSTDQSEAVATLCGQHASLWLAAHYEDSSLYVLRYFAGEPDVCRDVQAALQDFDAAEQHRIATAQKHEYVVQPGDPERLPHWLEANAVFLVALPGEHLRAFASLEAVFEPDRYGSQYIDTLEGLVALYAADLPRLQAPLALQRFLEKLEEGTAEQLAEQMSQHVAGWLEANYEDSPLRVLSTFGNDQPTHEAFRKDFEGLLSAEEARAALGPPSQLALSLHDPEPLAAWLEKYGELLRSVTDVECNDFSSRHELFKGSLLGSQYVALLQKTVALPVLPASSMSLLIGLKPVLMPLQEHECDSLAVECEALVPLWLEANYEDSPLRVLSTFGNDQKAHEFFRKDFEALLSAEEARAALGPPSQLALSLHDAVPLAAWLGKYGGLLRSVSETRLEEVASRLSLFESPAVVSAYIRLLQNSLKSGPVPVVDEHLFARLQEIVRQLSDADIAVLSGDCKALAPLWCEANYEASPLRVLSTFGNDQKAHEVFRKDFQALLSAEEARAALGPPSQLALSLHDAVPLAAWLESDGQHLIEPFEAQPDVIGRLLSVAQEGDLIDRYEEVLKQLMASCAVSQNPLPYVPPLVHVLGAVPDSLVAQVERECMAAADVWSDSAVDKVLLESLASFPRDASHTARLRDGLHRLAEAERNRLALAARCPKPMQITNALALSTWLSQYGQHLSSVPADLAAFLAVAYPIYDRGPTGKSQAELLFSDLQKLRADLQGLGLSQFQQPVLESRQAPELRWPPSLGLSQFQQPVLERLIATSPEHLENLASAIATLRRRSLWGFISPRNRKARKLVTQWLQESGISHAKLSLDELARPCKAASAIQSLHRRACELLASAGLPAPASHGQQLDVHLKQLIEFFPAAHKLRVAVVQCPAKFNRQRVLQNATPSALRRLVEVVRDAVAAHDAKEGSLVALRALMPFMAPSWLGECKTSIDGNTPGPDEDRALGQLVDAIAQLDKVQAFCDRVAGYHPLTLKTLGALTPIRESLRQHASQERGAVLQATFRHHKLLARMRHLESAEPSLASSGVPDCKHVTRMLEAVEATRCIQQRLTTCPEPRLLDDALLSGLVARVSDVLHEYRVAVVHARAAQASERALDACEPWFYADWFQSCKQNVRSGTDTLRDLRVIQSALPTLSTYQKIRAQLERSHPAVASALQLLGTVLQDGSNPNAGMTDMVATLMTTAWFAAQRQILAAHNSLLSSLGECRSQTGDLHASLALGTREQLLESLAFLESAVAHARAIKSSQEALDNCRRWFDTDWSREHTARIRRSPDTVGELRLIQSAMPALSAYQQMRSNLAGCSESVLPTLQILSSLQHRGAADTDVNRVSLWNMLRRVWLDGKREALEAEHPLLRKVGGVLSVADHGPATFTPASHSARVSSC